MKQSSEGKKTLVRLSERNGRVDEEGKRKGEKQRSEIQLEAGGKAHL